MYYAPSSKTNENSQIQSVCACTVFQSLISPPAPKCNHHVSCNVRVSQQTRSNASLNQSVMSCNRLPPPPITHFLVSKTMSISGIHWAGSDLPHIDLKMQSPSLRVALIGTVSRSRHRLLRRHSGTLFVSNLGVGCSLVSA